MSEEESCNERECPELGPWSKWSECSSSCGGGFRKKTRECIEKGVPFYNAPDNPCKSVLEVIEECNPYKCPMWTQWGEWTDCSKTCGGGQKHKYRQCVDHEGSLVDEVNCPGDNNEAEPCNDQTCPFWTDWSEWTECSASCGGGSRYNTFLSFIETIFLNKDNCDFP